MKDYLTVKEVAEQLNVSERTIYRRIKDGSIKCVKFGKEFRIKEKDYKDFLKAVGLE